MSEIKHTPGPWAPITKLGKDGCDVYSIESDGVSVCEVDFPYAGLYHVADRHEVKKANARLIAAAPELLEALQYALPYLEACVPNPRNGMNADYSIDVNCVDRARSAIAKATGSQS